MKITRNKVDIRWSKNIRLSTKNAVLEFMKTGWTWRKDGSEFIPSKEDIRECFASMRDSTPEDSTSYSGRLSVKRTHGFVFYGYDCTKDKL